MGSRTLFPMEEYQGHKRLGGARIDCRVYAAYRLCRDEATDFMRLPQSLRSLATTRKGRSSLLAVIQVELGNAIVREVVLRRTQLQAQA